MRIELTDEEAQHTVTLMDAACKAAGLQAAILAAPIFAKLRAAAEQPRAARISGARGQPPG
jgi:hypothetical protein